MHLSITCPSKSKDSSCIYVFVDVRVIAVNHKNIFIATCFGSCIRRHYWAEKVKET
jgi:hypothetical protein